MLAFVHICACLNFYEVYSSVKMLTDELADTGAGIFCQAVKSVEEALAELF